jgi:hypothetical protein
MGEKNYLMECPRCHHPILGRYVTGTGTYHCWCACGYGYSDFEDMDDEEAPTKEDVDEFYNSPLLKGHGLYSEENVFHWLERKLAPVSPSALVDEALARVNTKEGRALGRLLANRKPESRDGACPDDDLTYPPYSVEHGLLTWALRNLLHIVAAQHWGVYDARTMPDPSDAAALFADIEVVRRALYSRLATRESDDDLKASKYYNATFLMDNVLLCTIAGMNYARVAKKLLMDARQWHPYPGPTPLPRRRQSRISPDPGGGQRT